METRLEPLQVKVRVERGSTGERGDVIARVAVRRAATRRRQIAVYSCHVGKEQRFLKRHQ